MVPAIVCCLPMAAASFGIFDQVDRSDEPLGVRGKTAAIRLMAELAL